MKINPWRYRAELTGVFGVGGISGLILSVGDCAKPQQKIFAAIFILAEVFFAFGQKIEQAFALRKIRRHYDFPDWERLAKSGNEQQRSYVRATIEKQLARYNAETIEQIIRDLESR